MADAISSVSGRSEMAYTGETPWHGLGTAVPHAMTAEEAIAAASLSWKVKLTPVFDYQGNIITSHKAVVREPNDLVLGIVKNRYTPLQNDEAFAFCDSLISEGLKYHTVGALHDGKKIWLLAKLPGEIKVIGQDVVEKYLLLSNSHDGSTTVRMLFTPIRVVCANTLQMAEVKAQFMMNVKHTASMKSSMNKVKDLFFDLRTKEGAFQISAQKMVCTTVTDQQVEQFLYTVLGYKQEYLEAKEDIPTRTSNTVDIIKDLAESGAGTQIVGVKGSVWGAYNAVTEYADHHATVKHNNADMKLDSLWFGNLAKLKGRAFEEALALC